MQATPPTAGRRLKLGWSCVIPPSLGSQFDGYAEFDALHPPKSIETQTPVGIPSAVSPGRFSPPARDAPFAAAWSSPTREALLEWAGSARAGCSGGRRQGAAGLGLFGFRRRSLGFLEGGGRKGAVVWGCVTLSASLCGSSALVSLACTVAVFGGALLPLQIPPDTSPGHLVLRKRYAFAVYVPRQPLAGKLLRGSALLVDMHMMCA